MDAPPAEIRVVDFEVTRVNEQRQVVRPGGSVPLCQAINPIAVGVRLHWRLTGAATVTATVTVRYAGRTTRVHRLRLRPATGSGTLVLTPREERLPAERFGVGALVVRVVIPGRGTRAQMRFSGRTTC